MCGDAENQLALELSQHEVFVEREIVEPLCVIAEVSASGSVGRVWASVNGSFGSTVFMIIIGDFDIGFFFRNKGNHLRVQNPMPKRKKCK